MGKIKMYLAGSLFSEANQKIRKEEYELAKRLVSDAVVFSPVAADFNTEKDTMLPTPEEIFWGDFNEIESSDYVIFDMGDQHDPGLSAELGVVAGLNHYRKDNPIIPIGVVSDIRLASANKYSIPSYSMNHLVLGIFNAHGKIVSSFEEALHLIKVMETVKND